MTLSFAPERIETWPLERLKPYARNAKTHGADQVAKIAGSMAQFGWTVPVLVAGDGEVIAGHGRILAATQLGLTEAPVIVLDHLTEAQRRAYRIADNKLTELGAWDEALLAGELQELLAEDFDLSVVGFSDAELDELLAGDGDEDGTRDGEDEVPETPVDPVSRPGDLWLLGPHRLLCGDATVATDVERVLGGVSPLLMVSDPPYGVEYDPSWRNKAGAASTRRTGKVLNDDRADWREAWALFPGDVAYVWHGALHAATVAESLEAAGFAIRSPDHLGEGAAGAEPRRLPLAARAVLVRREEGRQGPLGRRPQADHALADLQPRPGCRDRPRHPEAGRVHAPADPQQQLARPGGLRAVHGIGHDADRGRDHGAGLPRHRAQPGLCRRSRRALAAVHRQGGGSGWKR